MNAMLTAHRFCEQCFVQRDPKKVPERVSHPQVRACCQCGRDTGSGIDVRALAIAMRFCSCEASDR